MPRLRFLLFGCLFVGCSLMSRYDQDGQPCDKNEPDLALSCLSDAGYSCVNGFCKKGAVPGSDGGIDAGRDAGVDAGHDAGVDSGTDAGFDAGSRDGGPADAGDGG